MKPILQLLLASSLLAIPAAAQAQDPAAELAAMETAAKDDVAALVKAASWAKEHGLDTEWRRLLNRVLQLQPSHEAANKALGNVQYEGRWMSPEKAEILGKRAAGLVYVAGVWVEEAHAEDARAGVFHFRGERVTRPEYLALQAGKLRHPRTGDLIESADLEKARNNLFPDGNGGWVDEAAANQLHARIQSPWVLRTKSVTVVSRMPLAELEDFARKYVDDAYDFAIGVFGRDVQPAQRPVVMLVGTADQFRDVGNQIGGASSAYGAFLAEAAVRVPGLGDVVPAVALADPNWGVYYLKHAVGLAVAQAMPGGALPPWCTSGLGSYTERFYEPGIANWFGKQFLAAGGLMDLAGWTRRFGINGDMEADAIGRMLFQAGFLLAFSRHGGDAKATELLDAVGQALAAGDPATIRTAVDALESGLAERGDALRAYLKTITQ